MTFKHTKFEDSAVMRSLERVAREKGMIKEEPLNKTAAPINNLTISDDLMSNIFTLCSGLRNIGFDKYANELETNYLSYKKADTSLYELCSETGEDLINAAHPKGSHKLENVAGDDLAVIETILDRHLKMVDVVNKKPTGKLASSNDIIKAVKKALGQPAPETAKSLVQKAINNIDVAIQSVFDQSNIGYMAHDLKKKSDNIKELASKSLTAENIIAMRNEANTILLFISSGNKGKLHRWWDGAKNFYSDPGVGTHGDAAHQFLTGGFEMDDEQLQIAITQINDAKIYLSGAIKALSAEYSSKLNTTKPQTTVKQPSTAPVAPATETQKLLQNYDVEINNSKLYKAQINVKELPNAAELNKWLEKAQSFGEKYKKELTENAFNTDPQILKEYYNKLDSLIYKLEAFRQKWLV